LIVEQRPSWREKHQAVHIEWWKDHTEELQYLCDRDREYVEQVAGIKYDPKMGYVSGPRLGYTRVARMNGMASHRFKEHFLLLPTKAARRKHEAELAAQTTVAVASNQPAASL
jgi:hypothetical protein